MTSFPDLVFLLMLWDIIRLVYVKDKRRPMTQLKMTGNGRDKTKKVQELQKN